jgi:signal transduction histidine kinase
MLVPFAASLAHEVRNPLTSIRIDLQRVEEALPAESPLRVPVQRALREVARLDRAVSGALRVARSGDIASDLIDLRVPLRHAIEVAGSVFERAGSTLDAEEAGGVPIPIRGDESALEQVFLNILLNAAQSLGTAGSASVAVTTGSGRACVVVRDSGAGIAPEWLERVFDPFVTTRAEGTGLGLPIARGIVVAHGGTIGIESSPAQGTTVSIELPLTGGLS